MPGGRCRIIVLGSTGSIGRQTLAVIDHLNALHEQGRFATRYEVVGLACGSGAEALSRQAETHRVTRVAVADERAALNAGTVFRGPGAAERLVRETEADLVVSAIVGSAGLPATLAAVELGRDVALANKESLVAAGCLVVPAARLSGSRLLPIDSEHAAIWQCLQTAADAPLCPPCDPGPIARVVLTASGGPFRGRSAEQVYDATPEQALDHPTWSMGPKVTIDSATLMNKALEVIEAHWLFSLPGERIDVLIHPQSIVHAMVEFADGSVVAQLAVPDMRAPIQAALTFPRRIESAAAALDLASLGSLEFEPATTETHAALRLAHHAIKAQGSAGATINAANEAAVLAFLDRRIPFGRIIELTELAVERLGVQPIASLGDALEADARARSFVAAAIDG